MDDSKLERLVALLRRQEGTAYSVFCHYTDKVLVEHAITIEDLNRLLDDFAADENGSSIIATQRKP
jgi:hypothetical protein